MDSKAATRNEADEEAEQTGKGERGKPESRGLRGLGPQALSPKP